MKRDTIDWTPLPGHHPHQVHGNVFYVDGTYRGMICEILQGDDKRYAWSFYDLRSADPELAVARSDEPSDTFDGTVKDLCDYIDGYLFDAYGRPPHREVLVHVNVQLHGDDTRTVEEIERLIDGALTVGADTDNFTGLEIEIALTEEI